MHRAKCNSLSALVSIGRKTITNFLTTSGRQFEDWSADYRLFSKERCQSSGLFNIVLKEALEFIPDDMPLVIAMDDSILRKTGKTIPGVKWKRDPLSPPFQTNLVRGQTFLQSSIAVPTGTLPNSIRMIPVSFKQIISPNKPERNASDSEIIEFKEKQKEHSITKQSANELHKLRSSIDIHNKNKHMHVVVDGRLSNGRILKNLPHNTTLIGRVRKDTKLYKIPEKIEQMKQGRKLVYGKRVPTPESLRKDRTIPYQKVDIWATGKKHTFHYKTISNLKWRPGGESHTFKLVVIAPLEYRLRKNSRILYRRPSYLLCTNPKLSIQQIIQQYVWRWDIEVNFRDEKQIIGVGEAQVRNNNSVANVPSFFVASYAFLLIAANKIYYGERESEISSPKWRRKVKDRVTSQDLINKLRSELWSHILQKDNIFSFRKKKKEVQKLEKFKPKLAPSLLYAVS